MEIRHLTGDEAHAFGPHFFALMREVFGAEAAQRKQAVWDWIFATPLAAEGYSTDVMAVFEGETPIGASLMFPMNIFLDGQPSIWRHPMALMMKPDNRGGGVALLRRFFSTYDNILGIPIDDRLGRVYVRLGNGVTTGVVNNFRPLRPGRIVARRKGLGAAGRILARPADMVWQSGVRLHRGIRGSLRRGPAHAEFEEVTNFGPDFDRLWQGAHRSYQIINRRDAAYLNWRYRDFPLGGDRTFLLRVAGQPVGYVVTRLEEEGDRRNLLIVDIFCSSGASDIYYALLAQAERVALSDAGADQIVLQAMQHCWANDVIRHAGYHFRKPMPNLMACVGHPAMRARLVETMDAFHFCRSEGDADY